MPQGLVDLANQLLGLFSMTSGRIYIGTSGWSYKHWANGRFYPPKLPSAQWLPYFAEHFDTVEINASFYRLPTHAMVEKWKNSSPPGFLFAVKMWKHVTHTKRLKECREKLDVFFDVVNVLGNKGVPLLVQLPPQMKRDIDRLDHFFTDLNEVKHHPWKVAVEFRNDTWLSEDTIEVLNRHGAAIVLQDKPDSLALSPNDGAEFVYIRRHGDGGSYSGRYTDAEIEEDAIRICEWLSEGRDVYVYYNNDLGGHAIENGLTLKEMLSQSQPAMRQ